MKNKRKLRKRSTKNKVSALDVFEEFESESSNFFVEAKSKLSTEEQRKIRENYDKAEKQHLGIGIKDQTINTRNSELHESLSGVEAEKTAQKALNDPLLSEHANATHDMDNFNLDEFGAEKELGNNKGTNFDSSHLDQNRSLESIGEQLGNSDPYRPGLDHDEIDRSLVSLNPSIDIRDQLGNNKGADCNNNIEISIRNYSEFESNLGNNKGTIGELDAVISKGYDKGTDKENNAVQKQSQHFPNKGTIREQYLHISKTKSERSPPHLGNNKGTDYSGILSSQDLLTSSDPLHIREQKGSDTGTIREHPSLNRGAIGEQLDNNKGLIQGTHQGTIGEQSQPFLFASSIHLLVGNERRFIDYVFLKCLSQGSFDTGPITLDEITSKLNMNAEVLKMVVKRLCKKQYILRTGGKRGKGGFTQFAIGRELYQKMLLDRELQRPDDFSTSNREQIGSNWGSNKGTNKGTGLSSSSSDFNNINNINNTNTSVSESKPNDLPKDWLQIQTPENVKAIGFGQTQIKQLFQLHSISASEVQESLEAFAYDLEVGEVNSRGSKLGFLMGILRRSGAYISEGLVSELKVQVENNEKRRREMADLEKRQAQDKLTAKAQEIVSHMTEKEKLGLVPENGLVKIGSVSHERLVMAKILEGLSNS
jgi:hypothetical protein